MVTLTNFEGVSQKFLAGEEVILSSPPIVLKDSKYILLGGQERDKANLLDCPPYWQKVVFQNMIDKPGYGDYRKIYSLRDLSNFRTFYPNYINYPINLPFVEQNSIMFPIKLRDRHRISIVIISRSSGQRVDNSIHLGYYTIPLKVFTAYFNVYTITLYGEYIAKYREFDFKIHKGNTHNTELVNLQSCLSLFGDTLDIQTVTTELDLDNNLLCLEDKSYRPKQKYLINFDKVTSSTLFLTLAGNTGNLIGYNLNSLNIRDFSMSLAELDIAFLTDTDLDRLEGFRSHQLSDFKTRAVVMHEKQFMYAPSEVITELLVSVVTETLENILIVPDQYSDCDILALLEVKDFVCISMEITESGDTLIEFSTTELFKTPEELLATFEAGGFIGLEQINKVEQLEPYTVSSNTDLKDIIYRVHECIQNRG